MTASRTLARPALGGLLVAASVPPFGWWPLGLVGLGLLCASLRGAPAGSRVLRGLVFGAACYAVGLFWVTGFSIPGWVVMTALMSIVTGVAMVLVPPERGRLLAFPAAMVAAEAVRSTWPFGGLPLSGIDLGQSGGPLAAVVSVGGRLLLVGAAAGAGAAGAGLIGSAVATPHRWRGAAIGAMVVVGLVALADLSPDGRPSGRLRVAAVQGGGPRGLRANEDDPDRVFAAHLGASDRVRPPVDVVLWPEDVVDVGTLAGSPEEEDLAGLARRLRTTLVAGIVEDEGKTRFRNAAVAWDADGSIVDRYDKVHRVPYGEYFPGRRVIEHLATIPDRDAVAGHGPGVLTTPAGRLGTVVSYEVFFPDRARAALRHGAGMLLVPTNAASFTTSQMPTQEVAAARLRARETGREVVQAAPTGYSAFLDHRGRVRWRSGLGRPPQAHEATVGLRAGRTWYSGLGDFPVLLVALVMLMVARSSFLLTFKDL